MKETVIPILICVLGIVNRGSVQGTGELGNKRTSGDHLKNSIDAISQNTEKIPGEDETCCHSDSSDKPSNE